MLVKPLYLPVGIKNIENFIKIQQGFFDNFCKVFTSDIHWFQVWQHSRCDKKLISRIIAASGESEVS